MRQLPAIPVARNMDILIGNVAIRSPVLKMEHVDAAGVGPRQG